MDTKKIAEKIKRALDKPIGMGRTYTDCVSIIEEILLAKLSAPDKPETKPLRYFKCVDCGTKFEFNGFPYWLPIAEGHVSPNDHKMCKTKYVEITKEEYENTH